MAFLEALSQIHTAVFAEQLVVILLEQRVVSFAMLDIGVGAAVGESVGMAVGMSVVTVPTFLIRLPPVSEM